MTEAAQSKTALLLAGVFVAGILVRKIVLQGAMDLSLEGALLAGFLGGTWVGLGVGAAIGGVCFLLGETVALPFYTAVGLVAGLLYSTLGRRGEIWSFSLNPFFIIYNFFEKLFKGRLDRNFIPFAAALLFAAVRYLLLARYGAAGLLYGYLPGERIIIALDIVVVVYTLGIALKIANNARMELIMREEENQLIHARLATLRSQINPHFLFNTLNSISALIRTDAEKAREMTRRLSSIFRKSLDDTSEVHSLREEIAFIDDFLSIECLRFGSEKLAIVKEIEQDAFERDVPTLILQPLVENAIKHGIARRVEGGTVRIAARPWGSGVEILVENDGPPFVGGGLAELAGRGMGLMNVIERLKIYACGQGDFAIEPRGGGGAVVRLRIPKLTERGGLIAD
jgi:two-component system LytT family sensor kinase